MNSKLKENHVHYGLDILLIAPPYADIYGHLDIRIMGWYNPPLGITYIQSYIKKYGFKSRVLDMACSPEPWDELTRIIKKNRPRYLGISCTTPMIPKAKKIAGIAKQLVLGSSSPYLDAECLEKPLSLHFAVDFRVKNKEVHDAWSKASPDFSIVSTKSNIEKTDAPVEMPARHSSQSPDHLALAEAFQFLHREIP